MKVRLIRARSPLLTVAGFAALDAAFWSLSTGAGLMAVGVSLLLLEWLSRPDGT